MGAKFIRTEDAVVSMITLDGHSDISCFPLQEQFTSYGVTGRGRELMVDKDECAAMIHINGTTGVTICG
jgi:hypothetical protein